jgi:hypothetical protein
MSVVVASVALLAGAPQVLAAAPWSAPQTISGAYVARWEPVQTGGLRGFAFKSVDGLLGFTPGGAGVAVLGREAGGRGITQFSGSAGTFGPLTASSLGGVAPSLMALYGRAGMLLGGQANMSGDPRAKLNPDILLDAAITRRSSSGAFTRRQVLAKGVSYANGEFGAATVTALAANAAGDAAAVVSVPVRGSVRVVAHQSRLFVRGRGQSSFRKVADIGIRTVGQSPAALAINTPGDVLVAWDDRTSVRARLITAGGRIGAEQRLGQGGSAFGGRRLVASMDATRRMLVAWMAQRVGEGDYAGGPGIVALAYAPPYGSFRRAQVVQRDLPKGGLRAIGGTAVQAALLRNRGVVVWTGYASGRYAVRTVDISSGRASSPRDLSPPGGAARLQGLAVGPRGGTVVAWSSGATRAVSAPKPPLTLQAVTRAADASAWGPIETVATTDSTGRDFMPSDALVAANPVSGQTVMLWSDPLLGPPNAIPVDYSVRSSPD